MEAPSRPVLLLPSPWRPRSAVCSGLKRKCSSVLWCSLATKTTSPPRPPSPPLGPPRGTYFSRRNARQPLPPSPAFTRILASSRNCKETKCRRQAGCSQERLYYSDAWMLTNLPMRPRSLNSTVPVTLANRVSSLPQPTLRPGLILVPRWRTMIDPPGTSCPPKTFTPSRWALESRPFLELPNPFLCTIPHLHHYVADLHVGEVLAMPDGLLILFLVFELKHEHLVAFTGLHNGALQSSARNEFARILERRFDRQLDFG